MKPLLKWAGGKRWLLPVLKTAWMPYQSSKLVEPFTGGMAVALGLNPKAAVLNDANIHLINFYQQVQKGLKVNFNFKNNAEYYYKKRQEFNELILEKKHNTQKAASIFYYLIRTGFNGLCRFNGQGAFNVPFGQHKTIHYKKDFLEYKEILQAWKFLQGDFENLKLKGDEFIYADPPYDVQFTQYHSKGFSWEDQLRLVKWLSNHQGPIIASNQATPRILDLYRDFKFQIVTLPAPRMISCNGNREPAIEMLAYKNFPKKILK